MQIVFNIMIKYFLILTTIIINSFAYDAFITPHNLKASIDDKKSIIVDVGSYSEYKTSHIKNAIYFDVSKLIARENNPYMLMDKIDIVQNKLEDLGINTDSNIIIYSHNTKKGNLSASYLAFILIYNGFNHISILDGGYMAWVFQNELFISTKKFSPQDDGNFTFYENKSILVDAKFLQQNTQNTTLMDSRSPQQYYGVEKSKDIDGIGHIPHAKNSFYKYSFLKIQFFKR